ncbi:hypothetical protein BA895_12320 [Humibacillus sp. DSM 29435]|uniref:hypothetical protein n=1 Tax=Humibacillus sp. DSM 29435 TaxID=1869167 RepID=UPI0008730342|nr:hypothetical protein [Humibacillus sp. DSM 29435]OFE18402.1 hypothetical protein BA895_12320 [Humibacillus sp. DSM 29435]
MKKLLILTVCAVGFVLGSRAGREPYEQVMQVLGKVKNDPRVREKAQQGAEFAKAQAPVVAEKLSDAARAATDKVTSSEWSDSADDDNDRIAERVQHQKDTGPQGSLP